MLKRFIFAVQLWPKLSQTCLVLGRVLSWVSECQSGSNPKWVPGGTIWGPDDWWPDCPIRFLIPRITPDLSTPKSNGKKMMAKILMIESYQSNRQYFWIDIRALKYLFHKILTKDEARGVLNRILLFNRVHANYSYKCQRPIIQNWCIIFSRYASGYLSTDQSCSIIYS